MAKNYYYFNNEYKESTNYVDRNITINRAPTDDSVKLLNEFQDKALENIICKISNNPENDFKWESYFLRCVDETFKPSGIFVLTTTINGKQYCKKIKVTSDIMLSLNNGNYVYNDIEFKIQRFIYIQICLLISGILLNDNNQLFATIQEMSEMGVCNFDINALKTD